MRARKLVIALLLAAALAPSASALDTRLVVVSTGPSRSADSLTDYTILFAVDGSDIASVTVAREPDGPPLCPLEFIGLDVVGPETWECELEDYPTLAAICSDVGFGTFVFDIVGVGGETDRATVFFDPGCEDTFDGFPDISTSEPVPPVPGDDDLCWDCSLPGECGPDGDYAVSIVSLEEVTLTGEVLEGVVTLPACWSPNACLPPDDYGLEVVALAYYDRFTPGTTALGDPFLFSSVFASTNVDGFSVTDAPPGTPPGVPGGAANSMPLLARASKSQPGGIELSWEVGRCCGAAGHHLVAGFSEDLPDTPGASFSIETSACALGTTGEFLWTTPPDPAPGDFAWFLVLANDGGLVEGSWGRESAGSERIGPGSGGVSNTCGHTIRNVANECGR